MDSLKTGRFPSHGLRRDKIHRHLYKHGHGWKKSVPRYRLRGRRRDLHRPRSVVHCSAFGQAKVCSINPWCFWTLWAWPPWLSRPTAFYVASCGPAQLTLDFSGNLAIIPISRGTTTSQARRQPRESHDPITIMHKGLFRKLGDFCFNSRNKGLRGVWI